MTPTALLATLPATAAASATVGYHESSARSECLARSSARRASLHGEDPGGRR
jgi:hypothetical protein